MRVIVSVAVHGTAQLLLELLAVGILQHLFFLSTQLAHPTHLDVTPRAERMSD